MTTGRINQVQVALRVKIVHCAVPHSIATDDPFALCRPPKIHQQNCVKTQARVSLDKSALQTLQH